ncbi:hypothetical protein AMTRI_Chr07g30780 [Amborella trichopoda]
MKRNLKSTEMVGRFPIFFFLFLIYFFCLLIQLYAGLSDTESEARALLKWKASLKNQTLNSWILNPNNKTSHRGWIGIDCNDQARVTGVSLVRFNLNGTLDQFDFPSLPCLATLDLSFNHLDGTIPATIGTLSNLTDLALLRNGFSTPIPNSLFNIFTGSIPDELGFIPNLKTLALSFNSLTEPIPSSLGMLRNISILSLSTCGLNSSIPPQIGYMKNLFSLDLSENHLTDFLSISGLPLVTLFTDDNNFSGAIPADFGQSNQLEDINFSSNSFYGALPSRVCDNNKLMYFDASYYSFMGLLPESLRNCTSLIWLSLNKNYLDGNISEDLGNYPDLSGLYISENQFFGFIPQNIGKTMPNLTFLSVGNNHITGPIPSTLMSLQYLNASYNHITGNIPSSMPNMMRLSLSNNLITGSTSASVGNMSELAIFNLSENNLTGTMPSLPPTLNYFMISNNHIMGNIPNSIGYLSNVYILDVYGNGLSGIIPPSSGNCSLLEVLDLSNNNLLESIPWSLGNLENLLTFRLNDNKLSGEIPSSLKNCSNLEIIDFGENQLSGDIPPWIGESLSSLQVLDLAINKFSGNIPDTFGNFTAMKNKQTHLHEGSYKYYYHDKIIISTKGEMLTYTRTLSLVASINISCNNLYGAILEELTNLVGGIPSGISSLTFLSYFNVLDNNLSGPIPISNQFDTFNVSTYYRNQYLCGPPLLAKCDESALAAANDECDRVGSGVPWFDISIVIGFIVENISVCLVLAFIKRWRDTYFKFADAIFMNLSWELQS